MRITACGRGNVGGGLATLWERKGHEVQRLGREGGDVSNSDVVLLAVPGGAVPEALDKLQGLSGKLVIDATNRFGVSPPEGFSSNAEYVKSRTNGPTAKVFNLNFAVLYDSLADARLKPHQLWCGDDASRETVEQLTKDAGFDPIYAGDLTKASALESMIEGHIAVLQQIGPFVYRMASPTDL